jgi:DNA adenine methylase
MAKPIVKWAGGKSKLRAELLGRLPERIRTYAEPFAGGAALFFGLEEDASRTFDRAVLSDQNEDLVAAYRAVRDDVDALIERLSSFRYDADEFYRVRAVDPSQMSDVERGARLIYLNRTCFNGLWRVNAKGAFNVPFGRYKNPLIVDEENLRAASKALSRSEVRVADFADVTAPLGPGDVVYFDPPYVPLRPTASFTAYTGGGFGPPDQERLLAELARLRDRGVLAMLSNADTPGTREMYREFAMHVVSAPRAINSRASGRGNVSELIVTSWGPPGVQPPESAQSPQARRRESLGKGGGRRP